MSFVLLPAIDVVDGRVVRSAAEGSGEESSAVGPLEVARGWQADGADWIHLVDLDAAFRRASNGTLLASVIEQLDVNVELSGGIYDDVSLDRALSTGCERAILGTAALSHREWCERVIARHGDRIAVGLDVRVDKHLDGTVRHRLAPRGLADDRGDLWETIEWLDRSGCARYVVADVSRDGMLVGPNLELYLAVANATAAQVIASGGVSSIEDLVVLAEAAAAGANVEGSIVGKALHTGRFTLAEALEAVARVSRSR